MDELTDRQLNGYPVGRAAAGRQGEGQQLDRLADMSQASASPTQRRLSLRNNVRERLGSRLDIRARLGPQGSVLQRLGLQGGQQDNHCNEERRSAVCSQRSIQERLGPQGSQPDNPHNEDHEERRFAAYFRRYDSRRQATENLSQAQSTNTPPRPRRRQARPSQTNEEVDQRRQRDRPAMMRDRITSSAFKKGLPAEHDLYRELTITPSQTLAEVYATAERYALWDDDRIAARKSAKQENQPTKRVGQRSDGFSNKNKDKRRSHPQEDAAAGENYTKFTIPIHQILAQVKNKPWVRRPPPLKGDPDKRDTSRYCAFHGAHGHTTNNCFAWKAHLEELVREGHCTEFVAKQAIQRIEDRDTAKEPPQKVIRINTILADTKESGLTSKEKKRKIKQATMISQVSTDLPPAEDDPVIGLQKKDLIGLDMPHNDALVISIQIAQAMVDRIHADEGSVANILQLAVIQQMGLETKINKSARSLTGFNGATTVTVGTIDLDVHSLPVVNLQTFMVNDEVSPYNGILGRPWIGKINAQSKRQDQAEEICPEVFPEEGWKPEGDVELIPLDPDQPDMKSRIGSRLSPEETVELTTFLQNNKDMFAWSPSDMPGVNLNIICHRLHVSPACKPVAQKIRNFAPE
ncbi:unnamed protein product [Prunus brigantina]